MNARDALEVVRQQLETLRNLVPDIEADSLADTALAVLSNLVERAGEPVAGHKKACTQCVDGTVPMTMNRPCPHCTPTIRTNRTRSQP